MFLFFLFFNETSTLLLPTPCILYSNRSPLSATTTWQSCLSWHVCFGRKKCLILFIFHCSTYQNFAKSIPLYSANVLHMQIVSKTLPLLINSFKYVSWLFALCLQTASYTHIQTFDWTGYIIAYYIILFSLISFLNEHTFQRIVFYERADYNRIIWLFYFPLEFVKMAEKLLN